MSGLGDAAERMRHMSCVEMSMIVEQHRMWRLRIELERKCQGHPELCDCADCKVVNGDWQLNPTNMTYYPAGGAV